MIVVQYSLFYNKSEPELRPEFFYIDSSGTSFDSNKSITTLMPALVFCACVVVRISEVPALTRWRKLMSQFGFWAVHIGSILKSGLLFLNHSTSPLNQLSLAYLMQLCCSLHFFDIKQLWKLIKFQAMVHMSVVLNGNNVHLDRNRSEEWTVWWGGEYTHGATQGKGL